MSLSPSPPPKPAKKKTFMFKRANLGNTSNSTSDELSFFSRNRENYVGAVEPREEKKLEVIKKKNTRSCENGVSSPPKRAKRRGTTDDDDDDSGDEVISAQKRHANARERYKGSAITLSDPESSPPPTGRDGKAKSRIRDTSLTPPPVLYAESIYSESIPHRTVSGSHIRVRTTTNTRNLSPPQSTSVPSGDEDDLVLTSITIADAKTPIDEDAEMLAAIEARARARVAAAAAAAANSRSGLLSPPPPPDPVISILVSSDIENTRPLVVRRRINQSLKVVRSTWCTRQGFTDDQAADIFLTWKGNKVFDHNTCRGIGIGVDEMGNLEEEDADGNVHFEAMTAEMWGEREREKERRYTTEVPETVPEVAEAAAPSIRLILKSKGYEDFKLKVRQDTKISKIISAFRDTRGIGEEQMITLDFDGDVLDPDETVGDTELDDNFGIDVYIN